MQTNKGEEMITKNELYAGTDGIFRHTMKLSTGLKPWMFLREYVQNGFDAHKRIDSDNKKVIVDFDHLYYYENKVFKLCFIDNAVGMSAIECEKYLLKMFDTSGTDKNFGIGAKISGAKRNKTILVRTKKKGEPAGYMFVLNITDDGYYLEQFDNNKRHLEIDMKEFPRQIQESGHGTAVTFLGLSDTDDTMATWSDHGLPKGEWKAAILNDTFFRLPSKIDLFCRINYHKRTDQMEFDEDSNNFNWRQSDGGECRLANLKGTEHEYDSASKQKGVVNLKDGTKIHWFILKDNKKHGFYLRRRKSRIAFVYDNENYNTKFGARADFPSWNIHYCSDRVALFVEVDSKIYKPDVHRKYLKKVGSSIHSESTGSELPVEEWQKEWRDYFPIAISKEEESVAENAESNEIDLNTLKNLPFIKDQDLGTTNPEGFDVQEDIEDALTKAIRISEEKKKRSKIKKRGPGFGDLDDYIRRKSEKSSKSKAVSAEPNFMPHKVTQISAEDEDHELYGWASKYVENNDEVIINSKYKGLSKCIEIYMPKLNNPQQAKKIREFIVNAYVDRLKLAICQAKMIKGTLKLEDFEVMTSKQALTMVVSPNVREDSFLRKEISKMRS